MKKGAVYLGFVISGFFLWLALKHTSVEAMAAAFSRASLWPLIPMFVCLIGFYWLKALRWSVVLSPTHVISGPALVPAMMVGAAGNNLLPAHMGELVRVYFAGHKFNVPKSTVLASLVVERLFDFLTVLVLLAIAFLLGEFSDHLFAAGAFLFCVASVAAIGCFLLVLYTVWFEQLVRERLPFLSESLRHAIAKQLVLLADGLIALRSSHLYLNVIINSLAQWLLMAGCIYCALIAFDIDANFYRAIVVLGLTVAGLTLPSSPGFFGTIEYCFVLGLAAAGVDANTALSAAIYYHLPAWVVVTLAGLYFAHKYRFSFRRSRTELLQDKPTD
ncbi:MAG: flippase-like domain-containing protein [Gammaproteobacteria bacterium]|nr:flippase-like domain-containing protein [Gammaproteobacteria bacterium]